MTPITLRIKKKKLRALRMMAFGLAFIAAIMLLDRQVRPLVTTVSAYQAQLLATKAINDAVIDVITEEDVVYNTIISHTQNPDGEVTSISTDMITLNRLKAEITNRVNDRLAKSDSLVISLPAGTLLGGQFLSGRGPEIEFRVVPAGSANTEIYNDFHSAGINQTLHQIMLTVSADISAVLPLYTTSTSVNTNLCIAETVIVGKVPSAYTDINGDTSTLLEQYNAYKAAPPAQTPETQPAQPAQ